MLLLYFFLIVVDALCGCRHYSGTYTIKASSSRFLKSGNGPTSSPGMEGVSVAFSPMARTLADLETFWRAVMSMKPWEYDPHVG